MRKKIKNTVSWCIFLGFCWFVIASFNQLIK